MARSKRGLSRVAGLRPVHDKYKIFDDLFDDKGPWVVEHSFPQRAVETSLVFEVTPEVKRSKFRRSDEEVKVEFDILRKNWSEETGTSGSLDDRFMNWSHQRIIGLGPQVLPLIIEDLRQTGDIWFWALVALVGQDVAQGAETTEEASKIWISWAEREGFVD